jgi:hypothetical protein
MRIVSNIPFDSFYHNLLRVMHSVEATMIADIRRRRHSGEETQTVKKTVKTTEYCVDDKLTETITESSPTESSSKSGAVPPSENKVHPTDEIISTSTWTVAKWVILRLTGLIYIMIFALIFMQQVCVATQKEEIPMLIQSIDSDAVILDDKALVVENNKRYIIYRHVHTDQGIGNVVSGLLAAHLLGIEFNRTVCVSKQYEDFHQAFAPVHVSAEECHLAQSSSVPTPSNTISLVNFRMAPRECDVKDRLSGSENVLYFDGNTYPRWPSSIPDHFFHQNYKPTESLLQTLPWKDPPKTVVHLREADGREDARKGLDTETLEALGRELPSDTFLVTNNVYWYAFFDKYGWSHPPWSTVRHSGLRGQRQTLQAWADWFTILSAENVYHTFSDFSQSAIHWNNLWGRVIDGTYKSDDQTTMLLLNSEYWSKSEEPIPRLVDRDMDGLEGCDEAAETKILKPIEPKRGKLMAMIRRRKECLSCKQVMDNTFAKQV